MVMVRMSVMVASNGKSDCRKAPQERLENLHERSKL
jgi:hypothetical protein